MEKKLKWPYIQFSRSDDEQKTLKEQMSECCVAFIDILGFKNMISNDIDSVILALRYIKMFCDSFFKFPTRETGSKTYPIFNAPEYNNDYSSIDEDIDDEYEMNKPVVTMFSDSIVISKTIDDFFDLSEFVEFISKIQYQLLLEGILIRGGISIGELYHSDKYIFGSALISAYKIESEKAIYPRIVIDENVIKRYTEILDKKFNQSYNTYILYDNKKYPLNPYQDYSDYEYSLYIQLDSDGLYYINYLQDNLYVIGASSKDFLDISMLLLEDTYEDCCVRIMKLVNEGIQISNKDVQEKYKWLKNKYNHVIKMYLHSYAQLFSDPKEKADFFVNWDKLYIK